MAARGDLASSAPTAPDAAVHSEPRSPWVSVGAGILVAFLAWPIRSVLPQMGLETSWRTGLHLASHGGLQFGKDVVFTYGPYGFLSVPSFVTSWTGFASVLYSTVVVVGFAVTVVALGRRTFTLLGSVLLVYLALLLTYLDPAELSIVLLFLWCLFWLSDHPESRVPRSLPIWGGALAALQLLIKFDVGIASAAIVGLTIWGAGRDRVRNELIAGGSFASFFFVLWVVARQPLDGIGVFFHRSLQVASGYSTGMAFEAPQRLSEYIVVGLVVFVVFPLFLAGHRLPRKVKPVVFLLLAVMTYTEFLHGFIRHDWYHATPFLVFASVLPIALSWKGQLRTIAFACCALPLVFAWVLPTGDNSLSPVPNLRPSFAFEELKLVLDPGYRHSQIAAERSRLRGQLGVDPIALSLLTGHRVAVDPWEISTVWVYQLDWRPFPVFQTYSAYTPALDKLNADVLGSPSGPDRILRQPLLAIDGRYPLFESPAYELAMICHFAVLRETSQWQVLGRIPDRCSSPTLMGSVQTTSGRAVHIPEPKPGQLLIAEIDVRESLIERILARVFKPLGVPSVLLDGRSYRFVAATAAEPHVLCTPSFLGGHRYGGGRCPSSIAIAGAGGQVTIRFYSIRLSAAA